MKSANSPIRVKYVLLFFFSLFAYPALSQFELIKDINSISGESSFPNGFIERDGLVYFLADDGEHGQELWRTNGTSNGTLLIQDINPGLSTGVTSGTQMVVFNNKLYFLADDGVHGKELWFVQNAPDEIAAMVEDLRPGDNSNHIFHLTVVNGHLLFLASSTAGDEEWWRVNIDNSVAMVKDIRPGSFGADIMSPSVGLDRIFFAADDGGALETQLWATDGTEEGTVIIADHRIGIGQGVEYDGYVYLMTAEEPDTKGFELFKANPSGASLVRDINTLEFGSSQPKAVDFHGMVYKGELYFNAYEPTHGDALWKTDGTGPGTLLVKDIDPRVSEGSAIGVMKVFNDYLCFTAEDATPGLDLWRTDGTADGTVKVKDFAGVTNIFYELDGKLYFIANDGAHGNELWISDGTEEGTSMVQDFNPGPADGIGAFAVFEDKIFLSGNGPSGYELYTYTPIDCEIPQITTQPVGDTIDVGGSITLSVVATGDAITYQWQKDSVNIPGATHATFAIEDALPGDSGKYTCVVSNVCTTVTTQIAKVVVEEIVSGTSDEFVKKDEIILFPNPAKHWIQITMNRQIAHPKVSLSVYTMQGMLVMEESFDMNTDLLDVSKLSPGLYQIKIRDTGNRITWSRLAIYR